jgi:hypothetical protein
MASPDEIRAIRELQRQTDGPLSYQDAQRAIQAQPAKDFTKENVAKLFDENGKMRAELDAIKQSLEGMRIIGEGFAGQGPRGIMFTAQPWTFPVLSFGVDNLGDGEGHVLADVVLFGQMWTINAKTIKSGTGISITESDITQTITVAVVNPIPTPLPGTGTFVLTSINDVLTWTATTNCA